MRLTDNLVTGREALISRVLGFDGAATLNAGVASGPVSSGPELAAALRRAMNALKAAGINETGLAVDYGRLRGSGAYVAYRSLTPQLRDLDLAALATREERLAFWINLYNALILDAAIAFGVRRSVIEGRLGILAFFRRAAYDVGGQRFSANDIEHGILRANRPHWAIPGPQFGPGDPRLRWHAAPADPRIHCALNCASRSCPPIGVYDAARVDAQLDLAAASFVANDVAVEPVAGVVRLSAIFKWYAADFGGREGVIAFLTQHLPEGEGRTWLKTHGGGARLIYRAYDWGLNGL